MSAWRWGVYRVSYYIGRGLIRAARILAYATAGVLTRKELGRAAAGRWSDFGIDETYVLSGLFPGRRTSTSGSSNPTNTSSSSAPDPAPARTARAPPGNALAGLEPPAPPLPPPR